MTTTRITSPANPRVKALARLVRRAQARRDSGRFCLESRRELERAIAAGFGVVELWHDQATPPPAVPEGCEAIATTAAVIERIAYRQHPQGFVAVLEQRHTTLEALGQTLGDEPAMILVASGLEKPGNVGAILRSADAAGASGVFLDAAEFDLFNPNCLRASTGAAFTVPVVCDTPERLADWLAQRRITPIAATPEALFSASMLNLRGPVAIVVGSEDQGLGDFWRDACPLQVAIAMRGQTVDSLNVSVSAAVLMFEAVRQRIG